MKSIMVVELSSGVTKEIKGTAAAVNFALNYVQGKKKEAYRKECIDLNTTKYVSDKRSAVVRIQEIG